MACTEGQMNRPIRGPLGEKKNAAKGLQVFQRSETGPQRKRRLMGQRLELASSGKRWPDQGEAERGPHGEGIHRGDRKTVV